MVDNIKDILGDLVFWLKKSANLQYDPNDFTLAALLNRIDNIIIDPLELRMGKFYKRLVEIRLLMNFNETKAKQLLTNLIKELEEAT